MIVLELEPDACSILGKVRKADFVKARQGDADLNEVPEKAEKSHLEFHNSIIVRKTIDRRGNVRKQLIIPRKFNQVF